MLPKYEDRVSFLYDGGCQLLRLEQVHLSQAFAAAVLGRAGDVAVAVEDQRSIRIAAVGASALRAEAVHTGETAAGDFEDGAEIVVAAPAGRAENIPRGIKRDRSGGLRTIGAVRQLAKTVQHCISALRIQSAPSPISPCVP